MAVSDGAGTAGGKVLSAAEGIILSVNGGSSSLKVGCFQRNGPTEELVLSGTCDGINQAHGRLRLTRPAGKVLLEEQHTSETEAEALKHLLRALQPQLPTSLAAIAHRVVHGGPHLREHTRITPEVLRTLESSTHLAPLHIPAALEMIRTAEQYYPSLPQFACLDDAFHRTLPPVASHLPVPHRLFEQGVQRYGFHGLSCASVMRRLGPTPPGRLVIAHLGSGSSVTAVHHGRSIDTSMGLSPSGGIPMSTRTGDVDPAVLIYLMRAECMSADALEDFVNRHCGLAGFSGGEGDMQSLLLREQNHDRAAGLAVNVFCTAVRKLIGSYAALLGPLDRVIFTGGIGENSEEVRTRIVKGLEFLFASGAEANVKTLHAEEELEMAYQARILLV